MTADGFEKSLLLDGFLAPVLKQGVPAYRQLHADLFTLADEMNRLGQRALHVGCDSAISVGTLDPLNIGTRLLIRCMSNFQGAIVLAERGMTVEVQTLVRNCYENAFWLAAFAREPNAALEAFKLAEKKSQDGMADALARIIEPLDDTESVKHEVKVLLDKRLPKTKGAATGIEALAAKGGLHPNYVFYKQLSAEAAHPSLQSIDRYLGKDDQGNWTHFVLGPDNDGVQTSVSLACHALFSALAGFSDLRAKPADEDDHLLAQLFERYRAIVGIEPA